MPEPSYTIAGARRIIHDPDTNFTREKLYAAGTLMRNSENPEVTLDDMLRCLDYPPGIDELGARGLYVRTGRDGLGWTTTLNRPFVVGRVDWEEYLWQNHLLDREPLEYAEILHEKPLSGEFTEHLFGTDHGNLLWVRLHDANGEKVWIAKFACGSANEMRVTKIAEPDKFLVFAGGYSYVLDATRSVVLNESFDDLAKATLYHPQWNYFITTDGLRINITSYNQTRWSTPRIALDGISNLKLEYRTVHGLAVTGFNGEQEPFTLDLISHKVTCATDYSTWDNDAAEARHAHPRHKKPWWQFW